MMQTPEFTRPALEDLIALALAAGREILAVRDAGFAALDKADGSPVTIADQRAEAVIEAGLAHYGIPMIGEEGFAEGRAPDLAERFFCVDPLDGTRDFVEGENGEFTVNIALIEHGAPVMGVVFAPATQEMYAGEPGRALKGRFDARTGETLAALAPIRAAPPAGPWRVIASRRSGANPETDAFVEALGQHTRIAASSSIKFCRLAEGGADLYPRFGNVSEWDVAAGHAILSAVGGGVMRLDGSPLVYGAHAQRFRVPGFIAFSGATAASAARGAIKR
jgi:3'(2'), 5'-bisphosphate nucleotidase